MTDSLIHRGPDGAGYWTRHNVGIGHRRLSILDLSAAGAQPMHNEDDTVHLACNGEIYNYLEKNALLRSLGHTIRSGSDSETLLHLYESFPDDFLEHVNGMFAFCLYDERRRRLIAGVDRWGKKPLYYAVAGDRLILASEMKSLLFFDWVDRTIDPLAVDRYLALRSVPAPLTMFRGIRKLPPASLLVFEGGRATVRPYWRPRPNPIGVYDAGVQERYRELLDDAVRLRLQSDVPLGLYLSGGVDSAAVASLMARHGGPGRSSYTLSVPYRYDEAQRAAAIAEHLDFDFNAVTVGAEAFALAPRIAYHLDEPLGDLIAFPAYLLAQKAKERLTVVLTGDGADETLVGYFHQRIMRLWQRFSGPLALPGMGGLLSGLCGRLPLALLNSLFDYPDRMGPREREKLADALAGCGGFGSFYEGLTACFTRQDKAALYGDPVMRATLDTPLSREIDQAFAASRGFSALARLSLLDLAYWIPFIVIYRLDKLNMAHAVETRSPFLDYRLVELCLNLPETAKLAQGQNKIALRKVVADLFPPHLREPGKQAFYMPVTETLREGFLAWCEELVSPERMAKRGLFQPEAGCRLLSQARRGSMLANRQLTTLAMLETWFTVFVDTPPRYPQM